MAQRIFLYNGTSIENVKLIDWIVFYAASAIFQPYNGGNVKSFCYLGIVMSKYGNFNNAQKHMVEQASKALYGVFRKIRYF